MKGSESKAAMAVGQANGIKLGQRLRDLIEKRKIAKTLWHELESKLGEKKEVQPNNEDGIERRFLFTVEDAIKDKATIKESRRSAVEETFRDIVDLDERHVEEFVAEQFVAEIVESKPFQAFSLAVIFLQAAITGVRTDRNINEQYLIVFDIIGEVILGFYATEILMKWYCGFLIFWRCLWNVFDFIIVVVMFTSSKNQIIGCLRLLQVIRVLHLLSSIVGFRAFKGMKTLIDSVLKSSPVLINIAIIQFVVLIILAVTAVNLFSTTKPAVFKDFFSALYCLFSNLTQDGIVSMYNQFEDESLWVRVLLAFLVFINVTVGAHIFINLIVAVTSNALNELAAEDAVKEGKSPVEEVYVREEIYDNVASDINQAVPVASFDKLPRNLRLLHYQKPLQIGDFKGLTDDKLETYYLLLAAFDENLAEYQIIKSDLERIFETVKNLNFFDTPANSNDEMLNVNESGMDPGKHISTTTSYSHSGFD